MSIAAIGAAVSFIGILADSETVIFAGAFAAMAAIYPTTNTKKGGER